MTVLRMLVLSLTGKCNFACRYCYAHEHPQDTMSLSTALKAVNMGAESGHPFVLQFTGGEPLMAFDLMESIIQHVRQYRIPAIMQIQTNGSLLNKKIVECLQNAKVGIGISLDGRPGINDQLRCMATGQGACQYIIQGARQLALQKVETGITCVVSNTNVRQLSGTVEMAYYLGNVRRIGFDLLRTQGRGGQLMPPTAQDVEQGIYDALRKAQVFAHQTGKKIIFSQVEQVSKLAQGKREGFAHCHAITGEAIFVDAQGNLYPCPSLVGDQEFWLGHVDTRLNTDRQQAVTERCQQRMAFCKECEDFSLCGGGCFARWHGFGCTDKAYEVECAFKRAFIQWYKQSGRLA